MPFIVPFIPAIIAAGAAVGASAISANASKNNAKTEANAQRDAAQSQASAQQAAPTASQDTAAAGDANVAARAKQTQLAKQAAGRRQTILTGPLGEVGTSSSGGPKTLLGI